MPPRNLSLLSPLKTIESFNLCDFPQNKSSVEEIWLILSQLDVASIPEPELETISSYWCSAVNLAHICNITYKPRTTPALFLSYLLISQVSLALHKRLLHKSQNAQNVSKSQIYDPILAPLGLYDDLFVEVEVPAHYPIRNLPIFDQIPSIVTYFSERSDIPHYRQVISWSLKFSFSSIFYGSLDHNLYENSDDMKSFIKSVIDPIAIYYFDAADTLAKFKKDHQNDFCTFIRPDYSLNVFAPLFIRYSFITFFGATVVRPINSPRDNFYQDFYKYVLKIQENPQSANPFKDDEINKICQTFLYVDSPPIPLLDSLFHSDQTTSEFIKLSFLSQTIDTNSIDIFKLFETQPKFQTAILFCIPSIRSHIDSSKFIEYINEKNYPRSWINQISQYVKGENDDIDSLLNDSLSGNIQAAQALLYHNDISNRLEPTKSFLHCILSVLCSKDPVELFKYEDIISQLSKDIKTDIECQCPFTNIEAAIIFKDIHLNHKLDIIPLIKMLYNSFSQIIDKLLDHNESLVHLLYCQFPLQTLGITVGEQAFIVPNQIADFIVDLRSKPLSMIYINTYMVLIYLNDSKPQLDEDVLNLIIDLLSISILFNQEQFSYPSPVEIINKRHLYHLYKAIEDKNARNVVWTSIVTSIEQKSGRILNLNKDEFDKLILSIATKTIDDRNFDMFINIVITLPNLKTQLIGLIPPELHMTLFNTIIEKQDSVQFKLILPSLIGDNELILKKLGQFANQNPKLFSLILNDCNLIRKEIFEAVCDFSGDVSLDFILMLKKLVNGLPIYPITYIQPQHSTDDKFGDNIPGLNVNWSDEHYEKKGKFDLWKADENFVNQITGHNEKEHPSFFCYTCGLDNICLNCALKCHANHEVAFIQNTQEPCSCKKKLCCFSNPEKPLSNVVPSNPKAYFDACGENSQLLLRLFFSLTRCHIMKPTNPLHNTRLTTGSILDIDISKITIQNCPPKLKFISASSENGAAANSKPAENEAADISLLPKLVDLQSIIRDVGERMNIQHFKRRCIASPLKMAAVGGLTNDILVVCSGRSLTSYNTNTMQQLHTYTLSHPGFQIEFCPLDPSVFAVASLYHVMIFSLTDEGQFEEGEEIELMLESIGPYIFVNSIQWVPLAALQLAVVCNAFIKIYDVPIDRFSPIACFVIEQPEFFSSAVFVEYGDESYGLFAMSNGKIAVQNCNVDAADGPIPLTRFANMPEFPNPQLTISYNQEANLVFIASPPVSLIAMRLQELFNNDGGIPQKCHSIFIDESFKNNHLCFVQSACEGSLNFMVNPFTGAIVTIEFINDGIVETSILHSSIPSGGFPFVDRTILTISTVMINDQFCAIGKNGKIYTLSAANASNDDQEKDDEASDAEDENEPFDDTFIVPATFWTNSAQLQPCHEIEIAAPGISNNVSQLLSKKEITFPSNTRHKFLDITLHDDNRVIVGFQLNIDYGEQAGKKRPFVKLFHKKYGIVSNRLVSIPLKPVNVRPRHKYRMSISPNGKKECHVTSLTICVIDTDQLDDKYALQKRINQYEWQRDGYSVFDYSDSYTILNSCYSISDYMQNPIKPLFYYEKSPFVFKRDFKLGLDLISYLINNVSLALPPEFELNDNAQLIQLFKLMYSHCTIGAIRRVILKSAKLFSGDEKRKEEVQKCWVESILDVVKSGEVAQKQWNYLWRDITSLPSELTKDALPILMKSCPKTGCFSVLAAFFCE